MTLDRKDDYYREFHDVQDECKKYLYYHIILTMTDGRKFDGIIENVDADGITMLVGEDVMMKESENQSEKQRQYYNDDRPMGRFRRFNRESFPLNTLAEIALLSYIAPQPYPYYPYYSYYPYYWGIPRNRAATV